MCVRLFLSNLSNENKRANLEATLVRTCGPPDDLINYWRGSSLELLAQIQGGKTVIEQPFMVSDRVLKIFGSGLGKYRFDESWSLAQIGLQG